MELKEKYETSITIQMSKVMTEDFEINCILKKRIESKYQLKNLDQLYVFKKVVSISQRNWTQV